MRAPATPLLLCLSAAVCAGCAPQAADSEAADSPHDQLPGKADGVGDPDAAPSDASAEPASCPFEPGAEPQKKAVFTSPGEKPDLTIENEFRRLLAAAVPGSVVRISIYGFSRYGVANEVIAAGERGVNVRVVVDGLNRRLDPEGSDKWVPNEAMRRIRAALGEDAVVICSDDEPRVKLKGGCLHSGINHNKFAVFSELCDGSKNVVYQASHNLGSSQNRKHNNAVILRDDPELYAGYLQYWQAEAAEQPKPNYFRRIDGKKARAWFFPRRKTTNGLRDPSTDTIYNLLENVTCGGGTRVRVAMAFWNDSRDYLVDSLARLRDAGCDVRILTNVEITTDHVASMLKDAFSPNEVRFIEHQHNKYLFVDGGYMGAQRKLVWTGSHNWVYGAIRTNEEAILRIDDPDVFAAFDADWMHIWKSGGP